MALHTHALYPLLLLILAVIIHPSYGAKHLNGKALVEEICRHTSSHDYCVGTMIPGPPLNVEGIASTALGWAQIRALEAGTLISSLLKDSASTALVIECGSKGVGILTWTPWLTYGVLAVRFTVKTSKPWLIICTVLQGALKSAKL
ncbi:hypothetical protein V6N13_097115 [Hibiscus sabdariffa]|uniref:Pectinesterase inhibitor domain-containing protein n=1 Tax=Hibiscus sabdariffa TaxID=183260 RepID=A0ABR2BYM3_9ROSI